MDGNSKKTEERRIFDLVYGDGSLDDVRPHENPDFLVRLSAHLPYFGVEVTEYYVDETSARLDRIEGYSTSLLDGDGFRHKDDAQHVEVAKVDIVKPDDTVHAQDVPVIICKIPLPATCARDVAERIVRKGARVKASTAETSHTNLIIEDRTDVLRTVAKEDFYGIYFAPELVKAIQETDFREVFLLTNLGGEHVYAPLKMLFLMAEAYVFDAVLEECRTRGDIGADVDGRELFGAYLNEITTANVLVHRQDDGVEVIFGDFGIMMPNDEESVRIRMHTDYPMNTAAIVPTIDWRTDLGGAFVAALDAYRKTHSFSTSAVFPVSNNRTPTQTT